MHLADGLRLAGGPQMVHDRAFEFAEPSHRLITSATFRPVRSAINPAYSALLPGVVTKIPDAARVMGETAGSSDFLYFPVTAVTKPPLFSMV